MNTTGSVSLRYGGVIVLTLVELFDIDGKWENQYQRSSDKDVQKCGVTFWTSTSVVPIHLCYFFICIMYFFSNTLWVQSHAKAR